MVSSFSASELDKLVNENWRTIIDTSAELSDERAVAAAERLLFLVALLGFRTRQTQVRLFDAAEKFGAHIMPTHFYNPIVNKSEIESSAYALTYADIPGLMPKPETLDHWLDVYLEFAPELASIPATRPTPLDFHWTNPAFNEFDALGLYAFIRRLKPRRVIEIGSGYSTLIAAKAVERNGIGEIICIEPFDNEMLGALKATAAPHRIERERVQEIPLSEFETLSAGDILFIDSSHVSKFGSDVNFEFLKIMPRLQPGVFVHVHDIFLPYEWPEEWIRNNLFWNEQYLLAAFMAFNRDFESLVPHQLVGRDLRYKPCLEKLSAASGASMLGGGSYWFKRSDSESGLR